MREQIEILSIPIDVVTMNQAVDRVLAWTQEPGLHRVCTANAEMIMMAQTNEELTRTLQGADLVIPDGAGVLWAAEQFGTSFPERVTGVDLTVRLAEAAAERQIPVYFLGAAEGVAARAAAALQQTYPDLLVAGWHSGFFHENEETALVESIRTSGARIVFVALGVPRQEFWIRRRLATLDVVGIGVGGTFDVLAGEVPRAPRWMQESRLEWLYRLIRQPSRFTRMLALPRFIWAVRRART